MTIPKVRLVESNDYLMVVRKLFAYYNFISYTAQKQVTYSAYVVHMYVNVWFIKHQVNALRCGGRIHTAGAQTESKSNTWQNKEKKEGMKGGIKEREAVREKHWQQKA